MLQTYVFYAMYFQVLEYTSRDYIKNWYREISDDDKFLLEIRQCVQKVFISFSSRFVIPKYFLRNKKKGPLTVVMGITVYRCL